MIQYLHLDVIPIIFSYLSQYELLNILMTSKFIYLQMMKYINTTKFILIDEEYKLRNGCKKNLIISIKQIKCNLDWNWGLNGACQGGHECIIKLMIKKGANKWNWGLHAACLCCHIDIVKLMIEKGANNWNVGLEGACSSGNESLVKLMIEKGANGWNWGLCNACFCGHIYIVKLMIEKGANDWNGGLYNACLGGNESIIKLMIEKGATHCYCNKLINDHIK